MIKFVNGKTFQDVKERALRILKENISLDKYNYIIVPDNIAHSEKRVVMSTFGAGSFFNVKIVGLTQFIMEFLQCSKKSLTSEQSILIFKSVLKSNIHKLKSFSQIAENDGAIRKIFANINILAQSNLSSQELGKAGSEICGILGAKAEDLALLYREYYKKIAKDYIDKHIVYDRFASANLSKLIPQNVNLYFMEFGIMTAEELRVLKAVCKMCANVVVCNVCNKDSDYNRIYPRFLNDFLQYLQKEGVPFECVDVEGKQDDVRNYLLDNLYGYLSATCPTNNDCVCVKSAENIAFEIKGICREIRKAVVEEGLHYSDISIFCPDISSYKSDIARQFINFEIPYTIKNQNNLSDFEIAKLFLHANRVIVNGYSKEDVLIFSKNALLDFSTEDLDKFELYVNKYCIDKEQFLEKFAVQKDTLLFETANNVMEKLVAILGVLENFTQNKVICSEDSSKHIEDIVKIKSFYNNILGENVYSGYLNKLLQYEGSKAKLRAEIAYSKVKEILENLEIVAFDLHDDINIFDAFANILMNTKISDKNISLDSVLITNNSHEIPNCKQLIILGANDGVLVPESNSIGLFTYNELVTLEKFGVQFVPNIMDINFNEKFEALQMATKGGKVLMTYNEASGEVSLFAKNICKLLGIKVSPLIADNNKIGMDISNYAVKIGTKLNAKQELFNYYGERMRGIATGNQQVFDYLYTSLDGDFKYQNLIKEKNFKYVKANDLGWSKKDGKVFANISSVERYFSCPFKFYCEKVLGLKDVQRGGLDIVTTGSFIHRVLEKFFKKYKDFSMSEQEIFKIADTLCIDTIKESEFEVIALSFSESLLQNYLFKKVKHLLAKVVEVASRSDFDTIATELTFGFDYSQLPAYEITSNGKSYLIRGKIDRIDKFGDYVAIIDYKSKSSVDYTAKEVYYGERVQLLIYLNAYMQKANVKPFALLYMPLPYSYTKEDKSGVFGYSGLVMDYDEAIKHFDNQYENKKICSLPLTFNSKGEVTDKNRLKQGELNILREYADKVVAKAISEIEEGYIEAKPESCKGCAYGQICLNKNTKNKRKQYPKRNFVIAKKEE